MKKAIRNESKPPERKSFPRNSYECFDRTVADYIRIKAEELVGTGPFPKDDKEDIQQEFALEIIKQTEKYDSFKAKKYTFIQRVIENKIANMLKYKKALCRSNVVYFSLNNNTEKILDQPESLHSNNAIRSYAIKNDLEEAIASLPKELRNICCFLKSLNVSETARKTGLPRSTVSNRIKRIKKLFQEKNLHKYLKNMVIFDVNFV
jgi:RNA polymerase sigma-70 factor (ECF subfamily)